MMHDSLLLFSENTVSISVFILSIPVIELLMQLIARKRYRRERTKIEKDCDYSAYNLSFLTCAMNEPRRWYVALLAPTCGSLSLRDSRIINYPG